MRGFALLEGASRLGVLAGILLGIHFTSSGRADTLAERNRTASRMVDEALCDEIKGANAHRDGMLSIALEKSPDHARARWHSGYVARRNKWVKYNELPGITADDTRYAAYRFAREKAGETVAGQLNLANWCSRRKLVDQERAHLTRVLDLEPNHAEARRRLGFRRIDGTWLSAKEIAEANERARKAAAATKEWAPKLVAIRDGLLQESRHRRDAARKRLLAIDDPDAVTAIESVFCRHSEEMAEYGVRVLAGIKGHDASSGLARQAVFSPSERIRKTAAEKLRGREMFDYVPALLSAMGSQIQSRAQLYTAPNGRLVYQHMFVREGKDQNKVSVFETQYRNTVLSSSNPAEVAASRQILAWQRQLDAAMKARAFEMDVARQNARIQQFNNRVCEVLTTVTGEKIEPTPEKWWKWWNERNEVFFEGEKPVQASYRSVEVAYADPLRREVLPPASPESEPAPRPTPRPPRRPRRPSVLSMSDCLVAGTPVWTNTGSVAIEKIRPGDLVLSQDPETGELAYKPVLRTTTRSPGPLVKIRADEATIRCSGGHPFWISGAGWVKAREIKPGTPLHAVEGTLQVFSVKTEGNERTYNLIVADFHTYFAGEAMVLSHDNTIRQPTDAIVPGLVKR